MAQIAVSASHRLRLGLASRDTVGTRFPDRRADSGQPVLMWHLVLTTSGQPMSPWSGQVNHDDQAAAARLESLRLVGIIEHNDACDDKTQSYRLLTLQMLNSCSF